VYCVAPNDCGLILALRTAVVIRSGQAFSVSGWRGEVGGVGRVVRWLPVAVGSVFVVGVVGVCQVAVARSASVVVILEAPR
jgi:hypothetical protein